MVPACSRDINPIILFFRVVNQKIAVLVLRDSGFKSTYEGDKKAWLKCAALRLLTCSFATFACWVIRHDARQLAKQSFH